MRHLSGRAIVEIGTRNGDGMACFSLVARSAIAVEKDPKYCQKLEERSKALRGKGANGFDVKCSGYQEATLDADVFTWWQQEPHLKNAEVLSHLRRHQQEGKIRAGAQAILLFENGYGDVVMGTLVLSPRPF